MSALQEHVAVGRLPLTMAANRKLVLITWVPAGFMVSGAILAVVAARIGFDSVVATALLVQGLFTMVLAGIVLLVLRPFVGPQGRVLDRRQGEAEVLVELRRVHPAFVAAVTEFEQSNTTRSIPVVQVPQPPGST